VEDFHVDEFIARHRERQNLVSAPSGDTPQGKSKETILDDSIHAKLEKLCQPKADLNDDREIDIVFNEESGSNDKLPFLNQMIVFRHHLSLLARIGLVVEEREREN
jgi:hypothetical protein